MLESWLRGRRPKKSCFSLTGRGLLYSVKLETQFDISAEEILIQSSGRARLGPLSSPLSAKSAYQRMGSRPQLQRYQLSAKNMKFSELYQRDQESFLYKKNETESVAISTTSIVADPLLLLFGLSLTQVGDPSLEGHFISGGKVRPYSLKIIQDQIEFCMGGRSLFSGEIQKETVRIELPKWKAKLYVERL